MENALNLEVEDTNGLAVKAGEIAEDLEKDGVREVVVVGGGGSDELIAELHKKGIKISESDLVETEVSHNMNILRKFVNPEAPLTQEDIGNFVFGPPQRKNDEAFDDYKSRRAAENLMLKMRKKFGVKSSPQGNVRLRSLPKANKLEQKANKIANLQAKGWRGKGEKDND